MMTTTRIITELWDWRSLAWWIALAAVIGYVILARRRRASILQIAMFATSVVAFLIALASPLAALAGRYLFSAHMAQHLLLLLIVPLCTLLAWPDEREAPGGAESPRPPRAAASLGWLAGVGAMWFWHIPALCTASMRSPLVLDIQVVSLLAAGCAFWWPVFGPAVRRRLRPHVAAAYLFSACAGCSLLGIYITFSPVSVCPLYATAADSTGILGVVRGQWGFTHKVDQQVGGLLMWVPACIVYLGAILANLTKWYHVDEGATPASPSLVGTTDGGEAGLAPTRERTTWN